MSVTLLVTFYHNMKPHSSTTVSGIRRFFCSPKRPIFDLGPTQVLIQWALCNYFYGPWSLTLSLIQWRGWEWMERYLHSPYIFKTNTETSLSSL